MLRCPYACLFILASGGAHLGAQTPVDRIHLGFRTLSTGNWETALREWSREGPWGDTEGRLKQKLETWISSPRAIGRWEAINLPHLTQLWQRHWMAATFDQGVVYFSFDFIAHKGQWRLVALQATQDPTEVLPHLDLLPALSASRHP